MNQPLAQCPNCGCTKDLWFNSSGVLICDNCGDGDDEDDDDEDDDDYCCEDCENGWDDDDDEEDDEDDEDLIARL